MERKITGFHRDQLGDWVADLECGHTRHVRHDPPWMDREWVVSGEGREKYMGTTLHCQDCEESRIKPEEQLMETNRLQKHKIRVAEAIKGACLKAAIEAYQDAKMSGLCQEGAWEVALDAIKSLEVEMVLRTLPE